MTLDVLTPFRAATEHRQRIHDYTQRLWSDLAWQHGGIRIHVAGDNQTGPNFSVAKAVNKAWRNGAGEHCLIFGSGHIPPTPQHIDQIVELLRKHTWVACFNTVRQLSKDDTMRLLNGAPLDPRKATPEKVVGHCMGILAMRREALQQVGGMDERFDGWGYEDTALRDLLTKRYGKTPKPGAALTTLWHPSASRDNTPSNRALYRQQRGIGSGPKAVDAYISKRGRFL